MSRYDLCLAWNWEYDAGFARLLDDACTRRGRTLLQVTPDNLDPVTAALASGNYHIRALLDRASDSDERFRLLVDWAGRENIVQINPQEQSHWAWDKATMHLEFISRGLHTPYTIIIPPQAEQPGLPGLDLSPLGGPFAIKPAGGGGGWGVVLEATSLEQVHQARQEYPHEKVLLQSHIAPVSLDGRPAWFRVLVCDGAVYPCWWDTKTHIYTRVTAEESARFGLRGLREVARRIAQVCRLHLFSTEIALTGNGDLIVTDYVNDPVDLRLQSAAVDGVPDAIVENISHRLVRAAERPG
ncbi:MAG: hypothetical protein HY781_05030 [Chloroflexi bacterium]|nr:hypothetical protein [Chloroflexota bacterium]